MKHLFILILTFLSSASLEAMKESSDPFTSSIHAFSQEVSKGEGLDPVFFEAYKATILIGLLQKKEYFNGIALVKLVKFLKNCSQPHFITLIATSAKATDPALWLIEWVERKEQTKSLKNTAS